MPDVATNALLLEPIGFHIAVHLIINCIDIVSNVGQIRVEGFWFVLSLFRGFQGLDKLCQFVIELGHSLEVLHLLVD